MNGQSLWLGTLRKPAQYLMIGVTVLFICTSIWLIIGAKFLNTGIGMNQLLRPGDLISIRVLLWSLFGSIFATGVYLSDTRGAIEEQPTGPFDIISLICSRVAMVGVAFVVLVMFYEVISRYVFSKPTLWANELSLWVAGFVFLLAGLYAMQQRSHIRIYVIYDLMPRWGKKLSDILSVAFIWGFFLALVWGGWNEARDKLLRMETFGTAWDPPIPGTVKISILVIIGLVAFQALSNLIADWNKEPHTGGADEIDEAEIAKLKKALGADDNG